MPLSEHEQRILHQIERQFHQERGLARSLRVPADSREAARNAKRAAAGFVVGLLALSLSFAFSWVLALVGFVIMLATGVALVQCLRRLVRDRWGGSGADRGGGAPRLSGPNRGEAVPVARRAGNGGASGAGPGARTTKT